MFSATTRICGNRQRAQAALSTLERTGPAAAAELLRGGLRKGHGMWLGLDAAELAVCNALQSAGAELWPDWGSPRVWVCL